MIKKLLFSLAVTAAMFSITTAEKCFAGNDLGKAAEVAVAAAQEHAEVMQKGTLVMTRTLVHQEKPIDTQRRPALRDHVNKHLGKKITIKVREEAERGQNGVYIDSTTSTPTDTTCVNENQLGAKFCVEFNGTKALNQEGNPFVSDNANEILDVAMTNVEKLKEPSDRIVIDIAPEELR